MPRTPLIYALALCVCINGALLACQKRATNRYLDQVVESPGLAMQPTPPPCTQGDAGRERLLRALDQTAEGEDVGGLRVAVFLSLTCLRRQEVQERIGTEDPQAVYRAQIPLNERNLDAMAKAWTQESNSAYREAMVVGFDDLDFSARHALWARLMRRGAVEGRTMRPEGVVTIPAEAPEAIREAIRIDWCQRLGELFLERFDTAEAAERRLRYLHDLLGNRCDEALTAMHAYQRGVDVSPISAPDASDTPASVQVATQYDAIIERVTTGAWPPPPEVGAELMQAGARELEWLVSFIKKLDDLKPSCALVMGMARGFPDTPEREAQAEALTVLGTWEQEHLDRCGLTAWP